MQKLLNQDQDQDQDQKIEDKIKKIKKKWTIQ